MTTLASETLPVEERTSFRDYLPAHEKTRPYPAEMEMFLSFLLIPAWIIAAGVALLTVRNAETLVWFFGIGVVVLVAQFLKTRNPAGKFIRTAIYLSTFLAVGVAAFLVTIFVDVAMTSPTATTSDLMNLSNTVTAMAAAVGGVLLLALTFAWSSVRTHNNKVS